MCECREKHNWYFQVSDALKMKNHYKNKKKWTHTQ